MEPRDCGSREAGETPEAIRVGLLEEVTCQLSVGGWGIFEEPKEVLLVCLVNIKGTGSGKNPRVC